jgi:hypothetical protein
VDGVSGAADTEGSGGGVKKQAEGKFSAKDLEEEKEKKRAMLAEARAKFLKSEGERLAKEEEERKRHEAELRAIPVKFGSIISLRHETSRLLLASTNFKYYHTQTSGQHQVVAQAQEVKSPLPSSLPPTHPPTHPPSLPPSLPSPRPSFHQSFHPSIHPSIHPFIHPPLPETKNGSFPPNIHSLNNIACIEAQAHSSNIVPTSPLCPLPNFQTRTRQDGYTHWRVLPRAGHNWREVKDRPVRSGETIRLLSVRTERVLHSHASPAPVTGAKGGSEVTNFNG